MGNVVRFGERRHDNEGGAHAEAIETSLDVSSLQERLEVVRWAGGRRRHVVEEAARLVVHDEQRRMGPGGALHQRVNDARDEALP